MNVYILNTETMEYPIYEGNFRLQFPNASFPYPLVDLPNPYAWVKDAMPPSYDRFTQGVRETAPSKQGQDWYRNWEIYKLTEEEANAVVNGEKLQIKIRAENLLKASDWTQVPDVPLLNADEFRTYRATIRNIALNPTLDAVFPQYPKEKWN